MLSFQPFKRFPYTQQAFTAARTLLGVVLPAIGTLALDGSLDLALGLALGAFCIGLVDLPEPAWRKPLRMLAATLTLGAAVAAIAWVLPHPIASWLVLLIIAFCAGLGVAYGVPGTLGGLVALVGVDLMLAQHDAGGAPWNFLWWMVCGGLWYTAFSMGACALFPHQIARRALAESLTAAARHLRRRADCFAPDVPLERCLRQLADAQSAVIDAQQVARDVVLGSLAAAGRPSRHQQRLFNALTAAIDIHDASLALHGDFAALRTQYADNETLRLLSGIVRAAAQQVEDFVPLLVLDKHAIRHRIPEVREPLRALERAIDALETRGCDTARPRALHAQLASLADTLDRLWLNLDPGVDPDAARDTTAQEGSLQGDIDTALRVFHQRRKRLSPWRAVKESPIAWRYALRLTLAIALGTLMARWVGGHGTWVILTIIVVMSPTFGANQQRSRQRIAGTLVGCLCTAVLVWSGVQSPWLVAALIIASYGICFALARPATYTLSVFFGTIAILLLYHLLVPGWSMIEQRGLDTLIGGAIGALGAFVFPAWERRGLDAKLSAARQACRGYAAAVFADDFNMSRYRVSRRNALDSVRDLAGSHQRMLQEPAAKRHRATGVGDWLLTCDLMIAALASLGQWRRAHAQGALPLSCGISAAMVDRILDGATPPAPEGESHDIGGASSGTEKSPLLIILTALHDAALSMARANTILASPRRGLA